jgi:hypothetical protein
MEPMTMASRHATMQRIPLLVAIALLAVACSLRPGASGVPSPSDTGERISGRVTAGPTCPVVKEPPDSNCADRPVEGAVILILAASGDQVARLVSDATGAFSGSLAPGTYRLVPQAVEGLMGTAQEQRVVVTDGEPLNDVVVSYDTGIR